jgi:cysteine dioxygenase
MTLASGRELAPIAALQRELTAEFERDPRGARVAAILSAYSAAHEDWRAYAHFAPDAYTRNLVGRNAWYELLVLCWDAGQESPVHNHAGQNCWMAVLDGEIEEIHYHPAADGRPGPLRRGNARRFGRGRCAFINDGIALHLVRPSGGQRGVSLHLYSRPIETCNVYDAATGRVLPRRMAYHSVEGRVVAP